ncbi:MAG TPA: sigma factor [Ignavibacteriaceae bacterium]|nr:sigma factor [Ignavibacteriaceae bacterium]
MEIKNFSGLSDDDLIGKVKNGKYEYFAEIIKRYCGRLYRIALSYGILDDECKEVLELTYISAYEKINQFQRDANFSTWLSGILVTECLSFKSRGAKILEAVRNNNRLKDYFKYENNFLDKVRKVNFENAIHQLPFKYKAFIFLKS